MQVDLEEDFCCSVRQQLPFLPVCGCLDDCCHCVYLENTSGLKQKTLEEKVIFFSSLSPFLVHKTGTSQPSQRLSQLLGCPCKRRAPTVVLTHRLQKACWTWPPGIHRCLLCQSPSCQQQQVIGNMDQFVPSLSQVNLALHFNFVPISRSSQTSWTTVAEAFPVCYTAWIFHIWSVSYLSLLQILRY